MTDERIEELLRRYALRGPDGGVQSRVLAAAARQRVVSLGMLDYRLLMAAAACILAAVVTQPEMRIMPASAVDVAWRAEVDAAAAAIGGDAQALKLAAKLVPRPDPMEIAPVEEEAW